jgi:hypothetical protein
MTLRTCAVVIVALLAPLCRAADFKVFLGDEAAFHRELTKEVNSTVTDTAEQFTKKKPEITDGKELGQGKAKRYVNWVTRDGLVGKESYSYTVYDVNWGKKPRSDAFGLEKSLPDTFDIDWLVVETPAVQHRAKGLGTWGLDSQSGDPKSKNAALFDFTTTPGKKGIRHFASDLIDWEASTDYPGEVRLYRDRKLVFSQKFSWMTKGQGNKERNFFGIAATDKDVFFEQAVIILGEDNKQWAADRFTFGQAFIGSAPPPPE